RGTPTNAGVEAPGTRNGEPMFFRSVKRKHNRPQPRRARLGVEQLESRLVLFSASSNAWPHPELITIGFVPDGTVIGSNAQGYITSNLQSNFNARFGSPAAWQNQVLKA